MTITKKSLPLAAGLVPALETWAPLLLLPWLAAAATADCPPWLFMWALAGAVFGGVKWSSWWARAELRRRTPWPRALAYLFLWPGMDPAAFCAGARPTLPQAQEWLRAAAKLGLGALLLWGLTPHAPAWAAGWIGMTGLIFVLHFGGFHLLALGYRCAGIPAEPIMRHPLAARSLGEFWGTRWNRGFRDWAHRLLFRPAESFLGGTGAQAWVFLVSGLLHEAVISLPARGGYGGPTGYFLLQGLGILGERSALGRSLGLRRGWRGRVFTLVVVAGPAWWLFHPCFVERVMLPFLEAIGAR